MANERKRSRQADVNNQPVSLSDHAYVQKVDPRRRPEYYDAQLVREDQSAMANLSTRGYQKIFDPGKYQPNYWMESEIEPFGSKRANEPEE